MIDVYIGNEKIGVKVKEKVFIFKSLPEVYFINNHRGKVYVELNNGYCYEVTDAKGNVLTDVKEVVNLFDIN